MIRLNFFISVLANKFFSYCLLSTVYCLLSTVSFAQTTYSPDEKPKVAPPVPVEKKDTRKVLVIPFEPKLYMSEIDENVNKETKLNFKQIRNAFRSGLDYSVVAEFRKKYKVVTLMSDSAHIISDQNYVYESIAYKYEVVPDPNAKTSTEKPVDKPKVQNGQLAVTTNDQKKFMNTKITNPKLLATLNRTYGAEIFIFINELDIKNNIDNSTKTAMGTYERIAGVHYSIYDLDGKLLDSGLATKGFPSTANNPNKIVNSYFSDIAQTIYTNFMAAITPKTEKSKGVFQWQEGK